MRTPSGTKTTEGEESRTVYSSAGFSVVGGLYLGSGSSAVQNSFMMSGLFFFFFFRILT